MFAAWRGFASPLRHQPALGSCLFDDHQIWWRVEADSAADALALLPFFVAERSVAVAVTEVQIP